VAESDLTRGFLVLASGVWRRRGYVVMEPQASYEYARIQLYTCTGGGLHPCPWGSPVEVDAPTPSAYRYVYACYLPVEVAHGGDVSRYAAACYLRTSGGRPGRRRAQAIRRGMRAHKHPCKRTHTMHFPIMKRS
jgi:hypothetical protein